MDRAVVGAGAMQSYGVVHRTPDAGSRQRGLEVGTAGGTVPNAQYVLMERVQQAGLLGWGGDAGQQGQRVGEVGGIAAADGGAGGQCCEFSTGDGGANVVHPTVEADDVVVVSRTGSLVAQQPG